MSGVLDAPRGGPGPRRALRERVEAVVARIAAGDLASYGEVAARAGAPGAARAVGRVMATSTRLPWWRVVRSDGRLVPGLETVHADHLRAEGHDIRDGRVVGFGSRRPASVQRRGEVDHHRGVV